MVSRIGDPSKALGAARRLLNKLELENESLKTEGCSYGRSKEGKERDKQKKKERDYQKQKGNYKLDDPDTQKELPELQESTKINIRESLNKIDLDTDNQFDLRNMYDSTIGMSKDDKIKLAKMISMNESYRNMYNYLKKFI
jgi:hypothetical protein